MDVVEMVEAYLKEHGYAGLWNADEHVLLAGRAPSSEVPY